jgi:3-hydroxyisobutyrate dehydrogenase
MTTAPNPRVSANVPSSLPSVGWIGIGRMGQQLVERLLAAGCDVSVYNRTRSKAEPLAQLGASVVDRACDLADRDVVSVMVTGTEELREVVSGPGGLLSTELAPRVIIDSSTVLPSAAAELELVVKARGSALLAAPVSGNPSVVRSGKLSVFVSGPEAAFREASPILQLYGSKVTYLGEGEAARLVKICHNLLLGVVTQTLAEITVLAERGGVSRADFLECINDSVLGSVFSRYKTPAFVNLDFVPTFTGHLLRKDLELGLEVARQYNVPLPVSALVHQMVMELIGRGFGDLDYASLLQMGAEAAGLRLVSEDREVDDGLKPVDPAASDSD